MYSTLFLYVTVTMRVDLTGHTPEGEFSHMKKVYTCAPFTLIISTHSSYLTRLTLPVGYADLQQVSICRLFGTLRHWNRKKKSNRKELLLTATQTTHFYTVQMYEVRERVIMLKNSKSLGKKSFVKYIREFF